MFHYFSSVKVDPELEQESTSVDDNSISKRIEYVDHEPIPARYTLRDMNWNMSPIRGGSRETPSISARPRPR